MRRRGCTCLTRNGGQRALPFFFLLGTHHACKLRYRGHAEVAGTGVAAHIPRAGRVPGTRESPPPEAQGGTGKSRRRKFELFSETRLPTSRASKHGKTPQSSDRCSHRRRSELGSPVVPSHHHHLGRRLQPRSLPTSQRGGPPRPETRRWTSPSSGSHRIWASHAFAESPTAPSRPAASHIENASDWHWRRQRRRPKQRPPADPPPTLPLLRPSRRDETGPARRGRPISSQLGAGRATPSATSPRPLVADLCPRCGQA